MAGGRWREYSAAAGEQEQEAVQQETAGGGEDLQTLLPGGDGRQAVCAGQVQADQAGG